MHTIELRIDGKLRLALVFCNYSKNYLPSVLRLPSPANSLAPSDEGAGKNLRFLTEGEKKD